MSDFILDAYLREKLFYIGKTATRKTSVVSEQKGPLIKVIPQFLDDMDKFPETVMGWYKVFKHYCMGHIKSAPHIKGETLAEKLVLYARKNSAKNALSPEQFDKMFVLRGDETDPEVIAQGIETLASQIKTLPENTKKKLFSLKDIELKAIADDTVTLMTDHKQGIDNVASYSDRMNKIDEDFLSAHVRPTSEEYATLQLIDETEAEIEEKYNRIADTKKNDRIYMGISEIMDSIQSVNTVKIDRKDTERTPDYREHIEYKKVSTSDLCNYPIKQVLFKNY